MKGGLRRRLTLTVVATSAFTLALLVLGFNIALRSSLTADANRLLDARAQAALEGIDVSDGRLRIREASDEGAPDAQVWIYDGTTALERPQSSPSLDELASSLAAKGGGRIEDEETDTRLYALPVRDGNATVGTVVAGISVEPYERTAKRALVASVLLGIFVLVLIGVTTRLVVDRALRPVARMTASAADWSEHDLDRRFNVGTPRDELSRLASTFDSMLDRMAAMLRHERNFSAEVSHELRTPLSSIAAEAEVALRRERDPDEYREAMERISSKSAELKEILETLLTVARTEGNSAAGERADVGEAVAAAVRSSADLAATCGVVVEAAPVPAGAVAQVSPETIQRILAPLLENASVYAQSRVRIETGRMGAQLVVTISDDGPGVGADEREAVFDPGGRGTAPRNDAAPSGTGLGLALSRRLARATGGDVRFEDAPAGASVVVSLPLAPGPAVVDPAS
jgi:signal transduction histidine kinase